MQTTSTVIEFKGNLTFERIGILLNDLKNKKVAQEIEAVSYKKLLTVMIEVLENVLKYKDYFEDYTTENPQYLPEFELNSNVQGFVLISRNPVRQDDIETISKKINRINNTGEKELKKMYRETITNGVFSEKGGAGLGLIEMAKIVTGKLDYSFKPVDAGYSIFELVLNINHIEKTGNE